MNITTSQYLEAQSYIYKQNVDSLAPLMDHHGWDKDDLVQDFVAYANKPWAFAHVWLNGGASIKSAFSNYKSYTMKEIYKSSRTFKVNNGLTQVHELTNTTSTYTMEDYMRSPFVGQEEALLQKEGFDQVRSQLKPRDYDYLMRKLNGETVPKWKRIEDRIFNQLND